MSDDLDELDAALRRAMAALDGDAPAGYFEALPGRTLARLEDPAPGTAIDELPEEPARPLRAVQGLRPPADDDDDDDDTAFASQVMAAVALAEEVELSEPAQPGAPPRRDRVSASSAILRAVEDAAGGGERGELRMEPAAASSVGMRAVAVDVEPGELGDPRESRVAGSDLGARSASARITPLPVPPVEPARPEAAAVGARSPGAAAAMTEAGRGRGGRRVRAAILGIGGIGLAAVAAMYLWAGDRAPGSVPSAVSRGGPASPSAGRSTAESSLAAGSAASSDPGVREDSVIRSAKPGAAASGSASGSAATTAAAGSGVMPGPASGPASEPRGKVGPLVKRPGSARPPSKAGGGKPEVQLGPGAGKGGGAVKQAGAGAGSPSDESGEPGKKLKSSKPRPDRTSLSGDDIERAMTAIAGQARACSAGTRGTVPLRVTVAPSGRIAQVVVTGAFAGTPQGACVKRLVLAATFPAWAGAPQSFDYSYLLSD
jgi:hypothetical protein